MQAMQYRFSKFLVLKYFGRTWRTKTVGVSTGVFLLLIEEVGTIVGCTVPSFYNFKREEVRKSMHLLLLFRFCLKEQPTENGS